MKVTICLRFSGSEIAASVGVAAERKEIGFLAVEDDRVVGNAFLGMLGRRFPDRNRIELVVDQGLRDREFRRERHDRHVVFLHTVMFEFLGEEVGRRCARIGADLFCP